MKTNDITKIVVLAVLIVLGFCYVESKRSSIPYAEFDCPVCGSNEVLDFGANANGNHEYECADCHTRMNDAD